MSREKFNPSKKKVPSPPSPPRPTEKDLIETGVDLESNINHCCNIIYKIIEELKIKIKSSEESRTALKNIKSIKSYTGTESSLISIDFSESFPEQQKLLDEKTKLAKIIEEAEEDGWEPDFQLRERIEKAKRLQISDALLEDSGNFF